jgi:hypothetical protein
LNKKLTDLENDLIQTRNESRQDPINYRVKLDNQLAYVYSYVHSQDSKPSRSIIDRFNELQAQPTEATMIFQALDKNDLKKFEVLLLDNNIPGIIFDRK